MPNSKSRVRKPRVRRSSAVADRDLETATEVGTASSSLSLHDLFQQQIRTMLDRTDLGEEQKEEILIAAACPCCGAGGMSYTAKIKRRS